GLAPGTRRSRPVQRAPRRRSPTRVCRCGCGSVARSSSSPSAWWSRCGWAGANRDQHPTHPRTTMTEATRTPARPQYPAVITGVTGALLGTLLGLSVVSLTPIPGLADPGPVVLVAIPLVRTLLNIAAVTTIGVCLLPILLGYDRPDLTEPVLRPARSTA